MDRFSATCAWRLLRGEGLKRSAARQRRALMIRPEGTKDPERFPRGFVPLTGSESIESVYELLRAGYFVAPQSKIETIHNVHLGVKKILLGEVPHRTFDELVHFQRRHRELSLRILIQRDFWAMDDFNDSELNTSFGVQNLLFDNFAWSQVHWKQFVQYVDKWFPLSEHSHLTYHEYCKLIRAFHASLDGVSILPVLPKRLKLKPSFDVEVPTRAQRQPAVLYRTWLTNFRKPLMIQRALVVRGGCGMLALATRSCGVPMVRMTDPRPSALESFRRDTLRFPVLFRHISMQVANMFPDTTAAGSASGLRNAKRAGILDDDVRRDHRDESASMMKYDLIVYYPDQNMLQGFGENPYAFAPGTVGFRGDLEQFFERAHEFLTDHGVIVVCCTNFSSVAEPKQPHPVEYEVKVNRRWVILDYYDRAIPNGSPVRGDIDGVTSMPLVKQLRSQLKAELWVLHRVESLKHFAHIHGIPGAEAPNLAASHWRHKGLAAHRRRALKQQVELMGGDWGSYKQRLLQMLQEQPGDDEDEVAQAVRMALDPTYPTVLAERARKTIEAATLADHEFHQRVILEFQDESPRAAFDRRASSLAAQTKRSHEHASEVRSE